MQTRWDKLSIRDRSEMMKICIRHGVMDLNEIKEIYNNLYTNNDSDYGHLYATGSKMNTANKDEDPPLRINYTPTDYSHLYPTREQMMQQQAQRIVQQQDNISPQINQQNAKTKYEKVRKTERKNDTSLYKISLNLKIGTVHNSFGRNIYTEKDKQDYEEGKKLQEDGLKQRVQKMLLQKPTIFQNKKELQKTFSRGYSKEQALSDIAEAKLTGNAKLFYKGNAYFHPEYDVATDIADKNLSILELNNTKDRKKLSDKYGVIPFKQPDRSFTKKIKHIFNRSLTANGLIGNKGFWSFAKPNGPIVEYGAETGTNRYGAYTGFGNLLNPGNDVSKIRGPIDLYHQDALPLGWKKESDYNLFPQYDKAIKDGKYGIVPTYSVESYYSTRNSKPFDYFSPDTNINSAYSFYIKSPETKDGLSIKSGGDYIDLYTDKRTGKKYYRMRDMYDFNPASLVESWGANKNISELVDNSGKPFIYTTNWNMVNDPMLSDIDKQTLQWNLANMYGQGKQRMKKDGKSNKEIQEYKKFFQSYFNLPDDFEKMNLPIRNKKNLRK